MSPWGLSDFYCNPKLLLLTSAWAVWNSVILLPIAVTFYITWWFIRFFDGFFSPIYESLGIHVIGNTSSGCCAAISEHHSLIAGDLKILLDIFPLNLMLNSDHCCRSWICHLFCIYISGGSIRVIVDWSICFVGGWMVHQAHATREAHLFCF